MSRSQRYHSDQWLRTEGGRESVATSREPSYQGLPRSVISPRSSIHGPEREDQQVVSRGSMHTFNGERLSPASEFLRRLPPPHREGYMVFDGIAAMPPAANPPSPYRTAHLSGNPPPRDPQLSRASSSFHSPSMTAPIAPGYVPLGPRPSASALPNPGLLREMTSRPQSSSNNYPWDTSHQSPQDHLEYEEDPSNKRNTITVAGSGGDERRSKRYRGGRDEFDGSVQYLQKPPRNVPEPHERDLPPLPIHLDSVEQDDVMSQVNKRLAQCAFDFVALYHFPIPIEPNKPAVQVAADKVWTEWAYLLKRLATKRKIPSHAIYQGQIKELTTVLDNSLEMRHATKPQHRALKDDRTVLQFISAGIQVGKMLKDAATMEYLDKLYRQAETVIQERIELSQAYK